MNSMAGLAKAFDVGLHLSSTNRMVIPFGGREASSILTSTAFRPLGREYLYPTQKLDSKKMFCWRRETKPSNGDTGNVWPKRGTVPNHETQVKRAKKRKPKGNH